MAFRIINVRKHFVTLENRCKNSFFLDTSLLKTNQIVCRMIQNGLMKETKRNHETKADVQVNITYTSAFTKNYLKWAKAC